MRKAAWVLVVLLGAALVFSSAVTLNVITDQKTSTPVPFRISMWELLELVGEDFDANWDSLRVLDAQNREIPFQIDDIDGNKKLSSNDLLIFLFTEEAKIVVSDEFDVEAVKYDPVFAVKEEDGKQIVEHIHVPFKVEVDDHGLTHVVKYGTLEGDIFKELGIARVAGWVGSTYYIDGNLGKHAEKVSYDFKPVEVRILQPGPVCTTIVSKLRSDLFPGLTQTIVSHILATGEILVDSTFDFATYADLMKLQIMATHPLTDIDPEALHILPVFRRLVWAEQLNISPFDYWKARDAITIVDGKPYILFPATDNMKPLWWGATYIFASMEDWRANYSKKYGVFVSEILPSRPTVYSDFEKFVYGNTWVYESREFRDGLFRWIPSEFNAYEATKGAVSGKQEDWVAHFKAGDSVTFTRLFAVRKSGNVEDTIRYLEKRAHEFQNVSISK